MEITKSSTGNQMIKTIYKPNEAVHADMGKRKIFDNFSLLVEAGWKLKAMLEAAQVPHAAIPRQEKGAFEIDFDTQDAVNRDLIISLEQETYQKTDPMTKKPQLDASGNALMGTRNKVTGYLKV